MDDFDNFSGYRLNDIQVSRFFELKEKLENFPKETISMKIKIRELTTWEVASRDIEFIKKLTAYTTKVKTISRLLENLLTKKWDKD